MLLYKLFKFYVFKQSIKNISVNQKAYDKCHSK